MRKGAAREAPRRFVWNATWTVAGGRRARWACGQAAFEPVHMSTGPASACSGRTQVFDFIEDTGGEQTRPLQAWWHRGLAKSPVSPTAECGFTRNFPCRAFPHQTA
jgi:hypothetical protein